MATLYIPHAVDKYGGDKVMVVSFTRTAAIKIATQKSRTTGLPIDLPPENVGTLHSICYHALNAPTIIEVDKKLIRRWNELYDTLAITGQSNSTLDEVNEEYCGTDNGDKLLNKINIYRNKLILQNRWLPAPMNFYRKWVEFKQEVGALDFTDLIERCLKDVPYAPSRPSIIFVDEAQDFTALQLKLIRSWGLDCESIVLVGDDDQCSIEGTKVLTTKGYKNIETLNPDTDLLSAYSRQDSRVYTGTHNGGGYKFKIAKRYCDQIEAYQIHCDSKRTSITYNHIWFVKWSAEAKKPNKTVVYLMEKNNLFRIGWCQLMRADGCFHVAARANLENADKIWILEVFNNKSAASMYESYYSVEFGIPTIPFNSHCNNSLYTQEFLDILWQKFDKQKLHKRAIKLILYCQRRPEYPFWTKDMARARRGGKTIMKIRSCNLFSDLMLIPSHIKNQIVTWQPFKAFRYSYSGNVYSLDVEKYHTYIADGLITHNCIFKFSGASPEAFLDPPVPDDRKVVLRQSFRVPKTVLQRAMKLITKVKNREPKDYEPRKDFIGDIAEGNVIEHTANWKHPDELLIHMKKYPDNWTVMFLASCSYMLKPLVAQLREQGLPFHNPFRKTNVVWNPISSNGNGVSAKDILVNFLSAGIDDKHWNVPQFITWAQFLKVDDAGLQRGKGKAAIKALKQAVEDNLPGLHTVENVINDVLTETAKKQALDRNVDWLADNLLAARNAGMIYPYKVYRRHGFDGLTNRPKIIIGTIHSVKGEDASVVYLFPDISWQARDEIERSIEGRDSVYRVFYVGMTRAEEELVICAPATRGGAGQAPKLFVQL